jgi:hypothetical protein
MGEVDMEQLTVDEIDELIGMISMNESEWGESPEKDELTAKLQRMKADLEAKE